MWVKLAMETAHSHFYCSKQNHVSNIENKFIKIFSPHWLHKNIQPSKGEGTKTGTKQGQIEKYEDNARGGGG